MAKSETRGIGIERREIELVCYATGCYHCEGGTCAILRHDSTFSVDASGQCESFTAQQ